MATMNSPEMSKGAKWMIERIDYMQASYKEALMTAVTIIQYQTNARRFQLGDQGVPAHMTKRLDDAWGRYDVTRRHVEWYMKQNALFASSPSHPAIIVPSPQPAPAPPTLAPPGESLPEASPIPLTAASNMAYDGTAPQASASTTLAPLPETTFSFGDGMDLSSLGIDQLQTMINSTGDIFGGRSNGNGNGNGGVDMSMFNLGDQGMTPSGQTETDKLLASLSSLPGSQTPTMSIQVQPPSSTGDAQRDVDAILASFSAGQAQLNQASSGNAGGTAIAGQQEFSFDFSGDGGDVDLSELVGLFTNASAPGTRLPTPNTQAGGLPAVPEQNATGQQHPQQPLPVQPLQSSAEPSSVPPPKQPALQPQPPPQPPVRQPQPEPSSQQDGQPQVSESQQQARTSPLNVQTQSSAQTNPSQAPSDASQLQPPAQAAAQPQPQPEPLPIEVDTLPNPFDTPNTGGMGDVDMSALGMSGMTNPGGSSGGPGSIGVNNPNTAQNVGGNWEEDGGNTIEGIDLDDFDFGNSGMPNVEGDEFESMFAEFK